MAAMVLVAVLVAVVVVRLVLVVWAEMVVRQ